MASSRWLVTGAGGQLGRAALALARAQGVTAIGVTRAELDVREADAVKRALEAHRPDVVLNCAAFTAVDRCETEPAEAERANALAPALLAQACRGGPLLVHLSTDYVFDGAASRPVPEDAPTRPLSEYGRSKLRGEEGVRAAAGEHLVVRTQWVFGAGANFVRTILARSREGRAAARRGRPDGPPDLDALARRRDLRGGRRRCTRYAAPHERGQHLVVRFRARDRRGGRAARPVSGGRSAADPDRRRCRGPPRGPRTACSVWGARARSASRCRIGARRSVEYLDAEREGRDA